MSENIDLKGIEARLGKIFPKPMKPEHLRNFLNDYVTNIRQKEGEHNKRSYFKSKILEQLFGIDPQYIQYEEKRNDLYYAGIIFETKADLTSNTIDKGLDELKKYIEQRENEGIEVKKCVLTDGIKFYIYSPKDVKNKDKKEPKYSDFFDLSIERSLEGIVDPFEKLYQMLNFYPEKLPLDINIVVPRIKKQIDYILPKIYDLSPGIKYDAWKKYVSIVFGSEAETTKELYLKHSLLYYVAVLISAKILKIDASREQILNGDAFYSKGILNFIEPDNFFDFIPADHEVLDLIDKELKLYDFENESNDFFRVLYEDLVSPGTRHSLGEFYTPEWLAKILVDELTEKGNIILDPACGSGTFIKLILRKKKELGSEHPELQVIGFDINPIAVAISKANFLTEIKDVNIIPIYLADSLMPSWLEHEKGSIEKTIEINFDEIVSGYGKAVFNYGDRNIQEMDRYLRKMKKVVDSSDQIPDDLKDNEELINKLKDLVKAGKNHIWFYILRNIYNPYYYRGKVDIVIGNPPWLTFKDVKNPERQKVLNNIYSQYEMSGGPENKTQQDMAGFFLVRSQEFLKNENGKHSGKIGFVLTRSVMNGAQYNGLRLGVWKFDLNFRKIYDLTERANPFRKPSCMVIFSPESKGKDEIEAVVIDTKKKVKNERVAFNTTPKFKTISSIYYINKSKKSSGISSIKVNFNIQSQYKKLFHEGATILPRSYFFIEIIEEAKYAYKINTSKKYTINKNKRRSKGEFNFSFENFYALKDLVYDVVLGENIDNFAYTKEKVILPVIHNKFIFEQTIKGNGYEFKLPQKSWFIEEDLDKSEIEERLLKTYLEKFNEMEKDWERHRGDKFNINDKKGHGAMSVLDRINYGNGLMSQNPNYKYMVVYNKSGKKIRSAVIEEKNIYVSETAYYAYFDNESEAYYICGVLNSYPLIKILKESGILSERDIHSKPFEINIPKYGGSNLEISELQEEIANISKEITYLKKLGSSNQENINKKYGELNELVDKLLKKVNEVDYLNSKEMK